MQYTVGSVEMPVELSHLAFPAETCILSHCMVEGNGSLRRCFQIASVHILLGRPQRAFYPEASTLYALRTARKNMLKKSHKI